MTASLLAIVIIRDPVAAGRIHGGVAISTLIIVALGRDVSVAAARGAIVSSKVTPVRATIARHHTGRGIVETSITVASLIAALIATVILIFL